MPEPVIRIRDLRKTYRLGDDSVVTALDGVDLDVASGEHVAIMGSSGSGKSTLLNLLGCLDRPTEGTYHLGGDDVAGFNDDELSLVRGKRLGFIFQSYQLIPQLTVLENIQVPLFYQHDESAAAHARCRELAELVGLGDRLDHRPKQLSGGQQQRVAIARALVNDPLLILADEPTGNLDSATEAEVLALIDRLNDEGRTIVMVTHDEHVAARADRIVHMRDGRIRRIETTSVATV
ncbi:putative ABC transport system ATP-binding protein [Haloferula luteola]|uniref:Putative ABC transport system ATP-binding protein n=1 Tax=Haloferula luteola TaxID=595692 RepID=A0A840UWV8_9BACT|nr:ABC transporter ATP-binding protein [Haloferula luteola]MBB5350262.1 putative ABC transport system ATP-binding protein [Haloferula luteola]